MTPPRALTIAGSDSGGGAGIQADLATFAAHDVVATSALTAVTAQNTVGVRAVHAVPAAMVVEQIDAVIEDIGVDAIKIGMLATAELVRAVASALRRYRRGPGAPWIVVDPVMVASSGDRLLEADAVEALRDALVPLADLVTPNLPEARILAGLSKGADPVLEPLELARRVLASIGEGATGSQPAVLLKGGHAAGEEIVDVLLSSGGGAETVETFRAQRIDARSTHGTGCTLSAAIAARLACAGALLDTASQNDAMSRAVEGALDYLRGALVHARPIGEGGGGVRHFWRAALNLPTD